MPAIGFETIGNWIVGFIGGVGGGLVTLLVSRLLDWIHDKQILKRAVTYSAMRLAVVLEAFAIECANLISENQRAQIGDDSEGPRKELPELAEYPPDVDWKILDPALGHQALSLRNDLAVSRNTMYFRWDMESAIQSEACDNEAAKRGAQAWNLASEFRRKYRLPDYSPGFDVGAELKKYVEEAKSAEIADRSADQAIFDEIPNPIPLVHKNK